MDINILRALVTLASLAAFIALAWWAYAPRNRARFDDDARIPFDTPDQESKKP